MKRQELIRFLVAMGLGIIIGMTWLYGLSWGAPDTAFEQYAYGFWWTIGALVALIGCGLWVLFIVWLFSRGKAK
jgi:hypothetical protein